MNDLSKKKRFLLKDVLSKEITSGTYAFHQRFPGIQQIARQYHVSYLTASRAMKMLTDEGYLRCTNGVGHFVNYAAGDTPIIHKKVNFICSNYEYFIRKKFFIEAAELFRARGWTVNILKCPTSDISPVAAAINSPEAYSIICGLHVPWQHFQASFGLVAKRVLILGALAGNSEITSIISNEYETVHQAMDYFAQKGRRNIALLASGTTREMEALRIGTWRNALLTAGQTYEWAARHCFSWSQRKAKYSIREELPRLCEWLQSIRGDTDGMIVPHHHAAVVSCCLKCGIRVPDQIPLLLIALSAPKLLDAKAYLQDAEIPDMAVLDHNYAGHFQCALEILEERFRSGKNADGYWYFCPAGTIQKCEKA